MAPPELMEGLRRICDQHGIVLIADEVQTGFGRTGKMFAMEHYSRRARPHQRRQEPGRRLSALGRDRPRGDHGRGRPGGLGGTYAGNPLACAAALAVLDVFEEEKLVERANAIGARVKARLEAIAPAQRVACRSPPSAASAPWSPSTSSRSAAATSRTPTRPRRVVQRAAELGLDAALLRRRTSIRSASSCR